MKTRTKALLLTLCAVVLVVASVFGTMAYLTDQETVTNTFTVGQVHITMDEAKVYADGTPIEGADRVLENEYHLLPGHTYTKDPTIHVAANSEESYIFVKLEIVDNADLVTALEAHGLDLELKNFLLGYNPELWTIIDTVEKDGTKIYYAYYKTTVAKSEVVQNIVLFEQIKVPGEFNNTDMLNIADLKVNVTAYAVQKDGFADAVTAWNTALANSDIKE